MNYFNCDICGWDSWKQISSSVGAFENLLHHIYKTHGIKINDIKEMPATNAVFKVDDTVIKIYTPDETGLCTDFFAEKFCIDRALKLKIPTSEIICDGIVYDKYLFRYIITEYINGYTFGDIENALSDSDRIDIGKQLASITKKLNVPCEEFNDVNIIERAVTSFRYKDYSSEFNAERINYLKNYKILNEVYVHGDINPCNIIIDDNKMAYLIDFADSCTAPACYELPPVICWVFEFDNFYMQGYFDNKYDNLAENLFNGILLHDYGGDIIKDNFGNCNEINSLDILYNKIKERINIWK